MLSNADLRSLFFDLTGKLSSTYDYEFETFCLGHRAGQESMRKEVLSRLTLSCHDADIVRDIEIEEPK